MNVSFYATLREKVGTKTVEVPLESPATVRRLLDELTRLYPVLKAELLDENGCLNEHFHLFVNGRNVQFLEDVMDTVLSEDDTIGIFPPVGGG